MKKIANRYFNIKNYYLEGDIAADAGGTVEELDNRHPSIADSCDPCKTGCLPNAKHQPAVNFGFCMPTVFSYTTNKLVS
jgi:hypothetical protein